MEKKTRNRWVKTTTKKHVLPPATLVDNSLKTITKEVMIRNVLLAAALRAVHRTVSTLLGLAWIKAVCATFAHV